jgi:hypothetical protein
MEVYGVCCRLYHALPRSAPSKPRHASTAPTVYNHRYFCSAKGFAATKGKISSLTYLPNSVDCGDMSTRQPFASPVGHALDMQTDTGCLAVVQVVPDISMQTSIFMKALKDQKPIHGNRGMTHVSDIIPSLNRYEMNYLHQLAKVFKEQAQQVPQCPCHMYLVDIAIVFVPAGSLCQDWHMDNMTGDVGVNYVAQGCSLTEFAAVPYRTLGNDDETCFRNARAYGLPLNWDEIQPVQDFDHFAGKEHLATIFFTDCLHRSPAVRDARGSIFYTFGRKNLSTFTVVDNTFWNEKLVGTTYTFLCL